MDLLRREQQYLEDCGRVHDMKIALKRMEDLEQKQKTASNDETEILAKMFPQPSQPSQPSQQNDQPIQQNSRPNIQTIVVDQQPSQPIVTNQQPSQPSQPSEHAGNPPSQPSQPSQPSEHAGNPPSQSAHKKLLDRADETLRKAAESLGIDDHMEEDPSPKSSSDSSESSSGSYDAGEEQPLKQNKKQLGYRRTSF